jgi:hypothetical protein
MAKNSNTIPAFLKKNLESNILGKVKLNIYKAISGKDDFFPDERDIKKFLRDQLRLNNEFGRMFVHLLGKNSLKSVEFSQLEEPKDVERLLLKLEENPQDDVHILQLAKCPKPNSDSIGVYISCEGLLPDGYLYVFTFFDEAFPEFLLTQIEIRASQKHPKPLFSEFVKSDWKIYDLKNYKKSFFMGLSLKILEFIINNPKRELFTIDEAILLNPNSDNKYNPPLDNDLMALTKMLIQGKILASKTKINLSQIKPHSLSFCLDFPKEIINKISQEIKSGKQSSMLVYWNGKNFVMSDDYADFLAYKSLEIENVPVIILGDFPANLAQESVIIGSKELLPQVRIEEFPNYSSLPDELQDWVLEQKLKQKNQSEVVSNLFLLFIGLNELISNPHTKERAIHNFIKNNPSCLDVYGSRIKSEVWLGKQYRIDLAIQYTLDEKKIQLVELERANEKLFTEKGRLRSYVNHAIQQVEDWLQWWHENPNDRPKDFDSSILPEGLVVIGRNKNLSEDDRKRLVHLNSTRKVKVITYDDLLDRIESLIENLEDVEKEI